MAKDQFIQIRVSGSLKKRYLDALKSSASDPDHAPTATNHLLSEIIKFTEAQEKATKKQATLS